MDLAEQHNVKLRQREKERARVRACPCVWICGARAGRDANKGWNERGEEGSRE